MQTKSKRCISFYEDPEQARAQQEEEDAAIERATRAFELEAAKERLLDERDLREFARGVFRYDISLLSPCCGLGCCWVNFGMVFLQAGISSPETGQVEGAD